MVSITRPTVFIPVGGIYIQSQLVSKFHWHYCPQRYFSRIEAIFPTYILKNSSIVKPYTGKHVFM